SRRPPPRRPRNPRPPPTSLRPSRPRRARPPRPRHRLRTGRRPAPPRASLRSSGREPDTTADTNGRPGRRLPPQENTDVIDPKRIALCLIVLASSYGALVTGAAAGTYTVYSCQTPAGVTAPNDGWTVPQMMNQGWAETACQAGEGNMTIIAKAPNPNPGTV